MPTIIEHSSHTPNAVHVLTQDTMEPAVWADMLTMLLVGIAGHMSYKTICAASTVCINWRAVLEIFNP